MTLTRPLIVCALLGTLSLSAVSPSARAAEAGPSAKAMAEVVATGFRHGALPSMEKDGASDASIRCMRELTGDDFASTVQALMDASLTPAEIAEVDAYVTSAVGQREFEVMLAAMRRQAGEDVPEVPALTTAEMERVVAFQETAVARKFMGALESSMRSPDVAGSVGDRMMGILGECDVL